MSPSRGQSARDVLSIGIVTAELKRKIVIAFLLRDQSPQVTDLLEGWNSANPELSPP